MKSQTEVGAALDAVLGAMGQAAPPAPSLAGVAVLPSWRRLALVLSVGSLAVPAAILPFVSWSTVQHASVPASWLVAGILVLLAAVAGVVAAKPRMSVWAVTAVMALVALVTLANASGVEMNRPFFAGATCGVLEFLYAALPLALSFWVLRQFAPLRRRVLATAVAGSSGALLVLHLHCADGGLAHQALFHLVPWGLTGVLALLVRRLRPATFAP
jgi:hypothetical protein